MDDEQVFEVEMDARLYFRVRAHTQAEADLRADLITRRVETLMIDTYNDRFANLKQFDRDRIVEIYTEAI